MISMGLHCARYGALAVVRPSAVWAGLVALSLPGKGFCLWFDRAARAYPTPEIRKRAP